MTSTDLIKFLVAMIIIMNPLSSLTIFLQLTPRYSSKRQRKIAVKCSIAMIIIMIITIWLGTQLLDLMGITIASFRVAGGIILLMTGLAMLQSKESPISHTPEDDVAAEERTSIAVVPLAIPIILGPGAISTLIIAANDYQTFIGRILISGLSFLLVGIVGGVLFFASDISRLVGESVIKLITRIMGMIIMAIAVGMLANGIIGLIPILR
jgi:MarC family membrane protein